MNIHVSPAIQEEFKSVEFRGKPWKWKNKTLMKVNHKSLNVKMYYAFEDNFCWFCDTIPEYFLPKC